MSTEYVPAMKAKMGDWVYFITSMKLGKVAREIKFAEEIHPAGELDKVIQRDLSNRVNDMVDFLLKEKQRFYGALVVAIYKGHPKFHPVEINEGNQIVDAATHTFGLLQLDGSQTFYALDGQHRVSSIREACEREPDLKEDDISVIVLEHKGDKTGMQRTRRLFTKLNRYAKPTSAQLNITIDEDDCIAVNTRRLIREKAELHDSVKISGKQLGSGQKNDGYVTTLQTLYECNLALGNSFDPSLELSKSFLQIRPDDDFLDRLFEYLDLVWTELFQGVEFLGKVKAGTAVPGQARTASGGIVWARPIGQLVFSEVIARAINEEGLWSDKLVRAIVKKIAKVPVDLTKEPWVNIVWNPSTNRIIGNKSERGYMVDLLCCAIGIGYSSKTKTELQKAYKEYHKANRKALPKY